MSQFLFEKLFRYCVNDFSISYCTVFDLALVLTVVSTVSVNLRLVVPGIELRVWF